MANPGQVRSAFDALLNLLRKKAVIARLLGLSLLFIAAKVGVEHLFFRKFLGVTEQDLSIVARFYEPITKALGGRRKPQSCTLVRLESPSAPQLELSDCALRGRLAQILGTVLRYQPRAVVADFTLRKLECCTETTRLITVAQKYCVINSDKNPSPIPIVFGYDLGSGPKVLAHTSIVPTNVESTCAMGVTNLDFDLRTVPLQFSVSGYPVPSLGWAAALLVDEPLEAELADRMKNGSPLYTMLLNDDDFREYTITDRELLSGNFRIDALRGRVVVLGSGDDQVFPTVFGPLHSHVLQAGYLEALLDRHILRKIPECITFFVAVIFWYLVESRSLLFGLKMLLGAPLALLLLNLLLVRIFNLYGDFATISAAGFFVWILAATKENLHARNKRPNLHTSPQP